ncbi:MAG: glycosyltransferase [Actinomycetota bacterium]
MTNRPDPHRPRMGGTRPRTASTSRATRLTAIAVAAGLAYVGLRIAALGTGPTAALSIILLVTEMWSLTELALLRHSVRPRSSRRATRTQGAVGDGVETAGGPTDTVDVVVIANGATSSLVERTLLGTGALARVGRVVVVDAERRDAIADAVAPFDAGYQVDPLVTSTPLGSVLARSSSEFVLWLEAGQVPMPNAIGAITAATDRPDVAVVQCAVEPLNAESLVHLRGGRDDDALVRAATGPGRGRRGRAPWNGSAALLRRSAIVAARDVVEAGSPFGEAEVGQVLVALYQGGWQTRYVGGGRIREATAESLSQYLDRRRRRATRIWTWFLGRQGNPLTARGLSLGHRLACLMELEPHLRGLRYLAQALIVLWALVSGTLPFSNAVLFGAWAVAFSSGVLARRALSHRSMAIGDWVRHGWRTVETDLRALFGVLRWRAGRRSLATTGPADARGGGLGELGKLRLLAAGVIVLDLALIVRSVSLFADGPLPAMTGLEQMLITAAALGVLVPIVDVLQVIVLGKQRRIEHRLQTRSPITVFDIATETVDLSPAGVGVVLADPPAIGQHTTFALQLQAGDGESTVVGGEAVVRATTALADGGWRVGLEFVALGSMARLTIMAHCVLARHSAAPVLPQASPATLDVGRSPARLRVLQLLTLMGVAGAASMLAQPPVVAMTGEGSLGGAADRTVIVLDADGQSTPATVRYHDGSWLPATQTDTGWSVPGDLIEAIEVVVEGDRLVVLEPGQDLTVQMSRLVATEGLVIESLNRGGRWLPAPSDGQVLPGRVAVRLSDGSVTKLVVPAAVEISLPSGEQRPLG